MGVDLGIDETVSGTTSCVPDSLFPGPHVYNDCSLASLFLMLGVGYEIRNLRNLWLLLLI